MRLHYVRPCVFALCVVATITGCKDEAKDPIAPTPLAGTSAGTSGVSGSGDTDGSVPDDDGGGEPGDPDAYVPMLPPADPEILEIATTFAESICVSLEACVGPTKLNELVGREDCELRVAAEFLARDLAVLEQSIQAGRVIYDESMLGACAEGLAAMGCAIATDTFPAACEETIKGTVAIGEACKIDSDCEGAAFCQMTGCPSLCASLLEEGDSCHRTEDCGDGLLCEAGECARPARANEPCKGPTGKSCALGLNCWGATDVAAGTCHTNAETLARDEGEVCEPGGVLCKEGLSCVWNGLSNFHCEKKVAAGALCHPGLPGQCPSDHFCNALDVTAVGTCERLPAGGRPCVANGQCAPGYACVPGESEPVCARINYNDGACATDAACRSGYCNAGTCEIPPICGD